MDAREIKEKILEDDKVIDKILNNLDMHHIQRHKGYYTFGLFNGDNPQSTTLYLDNLSVKSYTRTDENIKDIIDLVTYVQRINKVENANCGTAVQWLSNELGLKDSYFTNYKQLKFINPFNKFKNDFADIKASYENQDNNYECTLLPPAIDEEKLKAYLNWNNTEFLKDNISYVTQTEFELGIDVHSHRITIPIRDELGRLIGVKGRRVWDVVDEYNSKYIYLHKCPKAQILYGLNKTLPFIKENDEVIICESEKGVMQLWSNGIKNAVAIGGHSLSSTQIEKIIRMNVSNVVIAFDKDITEKELLEEYKKVYDFADVTCIVDIYNLLDEKQSPTDDFEKWNILYKSRRYKFDVEKGAIIK